MKKRFSITWNSSKQPRKQRKYLANASLHIKNKILSAHLSRELIKKYNRRALPIRKGDSVKIFRGQFRNTKGKVDRINLKKSIVYVTNVQLVKKDGTKVFPPIHPSNLIIEELNLEDKERKNILNRKLEGAKKK